jgi:hypothetical protein
MLKVVEKKTYLTLSGIEPDVTYYAIPFPGGSRCGITSITNYNKTIIKALLIAVVVAVEEAVIIAKISEE